MIPLFKPFIPPPDALMPALEQVLYSGYIAQGKLVEEFEQEFGKFIGNPNVVAVSSCTGALHIALELCAAGDVISTPITAEPTNLAILYAGKKILWADVDPRNGNISPESVGNIYGNCMPVGAIMVVDYGGIPADIETVFDVGGKIVIEDAAHALGAKRYGLMIGGEVSVAYFCCFSFQAIKQMTTIEGGILSCVSEWSIPSAQRLRWFGIDRRKDREMMTINTIGHKYNFNDVQAAMGLVQLRYVGDTIEKRKANGRYLTAQFALVPDVETAYVPPNAEPSPLFFTILSDKRDQIRDYLKAHDIQCGLIHRRNDEHPVFKNYATAPFPLKGVDEFCRRALHVPCGWWMNTTECDEIVQRVWEAVK